MEQVSGFLVICSETAMLLLQLHFCFGCFAGVRFCLVSFSLIFGLR